MGNYRRRYEAEGLTAERELQPILERLRGCSALLSAVESDISAKIRRAKTAYQEYADFKPSWAPMAEWPETRERFMAAATALHDSSKIGRAIDELKEVRSYIRDLELDLKRLTQVNP